MWLAPQKSALKTKLVNTTMIAHADVTDVGAPLCLYLYNAALLSDIARLSEAIK